MKLLKLNQLMVYGMMAELMKSQLGLTYKELEEAMKNPDSVKSSKI